VERFKEMERFKVVERENLVLENVFVYCLYGLSMIISIYFYEMARDEMQNILLFLSLPSLSSLSSVIFLSSQIKHYASLTLLA
jgi:hypothetical protein